MYGGFALLDHSLLLLANQYLLLFIQNTSPFRIGFDPHLTLTEFGSSLPLSREMTHFYG